MNEIRLIKKRSLLLSFFILFSLLISENGFAQKHWKTDYLKGSWNPKTKCIRLKFVAYVYSGAKTEYGYLDDGAIQVSADNTNYYYLFHISTLRQEKKKNTKLWLKYKLDGAKIRFKNNTRTTDQIFWTDHTSMELKVPNCKKFAKVDLEWLLDSDHSNARFIRISGKWHLEGKESYETFKQTYEIKRSGPSMLKFNTPDIDTKVTESETIKMFKDSEAIVINGADVGANIKVYTTTGTEIKSVISNNDVVKINLPAKQIYIVHVGKSRYKVAM